ncbi:MAG: peptidoglycan DD-metalloendopeptidase family protein [Gammaproteobacteria bacterium]|nr:peptidoglycan DD-metalloendopeptidase family protein [Gammaproteobacteria bacterium]
MKITILFNKLALICLVLIQSGLAQAETNTTYYIPDAVGSPIAAMDEVGNVLWRKHYKPFGEELEQDEASKGNRIGYTGHVHDRDTGLTYMGARYYDPVIGRFMGMDPVGIDASNPVTMNRYSYANNNPYRYFDPDGRETNPVSGTNYITDAQLRTNASNLNVGKQGFTRTSNNWNKGFHNGVDIAASKGTPLVAPISGKVSTVDEENNPKGGNVIYITDKRGSTKVKIGMAHLGSISVKNGAFINEGDAIGTSGATGNASGLPKAEEHVHLSVRLNGKIVDPQKHFQNNPKTNP